VVQAPLLRRACPGRGRPARGVWPGDIAVNPRNATGASSPAPANLYATLAIAWRRTAGGRKNFQGTGDPFRPEKTRHCVRRPTGFGDTFFPMANERPPGFDAIFCAAIEIGPAANGTGAAYIGPTPGGAPNRALRHRVRGGWSTGPLSRPAAPPRPRQIAQPRRWRRPIRFEGAGAVIGP